MQVILLERIGRLGQMGDVVTVKDGFARNYLLPRGKALRATKPNMERFERERVQLEARNLELKREAEGLGQTLEGAGYIAIRQAGEAGQLYGSVSARDIADLVTAGGFSIDRRQVLLDNPIKALGLHTVRIGLHPEVAVPITVNVARTEDEAARQARGEDVTADAEDSEAALGVEEVFEAEELAREAREAQDRLQDSESTPSESGDQGVSAEETSKDA